MRTARNESGMALMLSLLFVVLLSVIVVEFCYETQVDASLAEQQITDQQAYLAAKSAVARGLSLLANDIDQAYENTTGNASNSGSSTTRGASSSRNAPRQGKNPDGKGGKGGTGDGAMYDSLQDVWAEGIPYEAINDAVMQCVIADEYGKINLNAIVMSAPRQISEDGGLGDVSSDKPEEVQEVNEFVVESLRSLFQARGLEGESVDALVDSIIDWVDQNDDQTNEGAEYDYYEGLELPFGCKNGPMNSVEELLMIQGMTPELFWGKPEEEQLPLTELLTVHGHPQGKININTAEWETLDAVGIVINRDGLADEVIQQREDTPYTEADLEQFNGTTGPSGDRRTQDSGVTIGKANSPQDPNQPDPNGTPTPDGLNQPDPFQKPFVAESSVFRIRGHGKAGKSIVRIEAYVWRNNGQSGDMTEPFRIIDWRMIR